MYDSNLGVGIGSDRSGEPENDVFLLRRLLGPCRTLKGWTLKPGRTDGIKKRLGLNPVICGYEVSTEATPANGVQTQP